MRKYSINLIPRQNKTFVDKLMYFLLHYFRYIIVLTQIVVISVFFARFSLDQEIVDLKEEFGDRQAILEVVKPFINEVDAYVVKQNDVKKIFKTQDEFLQDFNYVLSVIPLDVKLTSLQKTDKSIHIKGSSASILSIKRLFIKLVKDGRFSNVRMSELVGAANVGYTFGIEVLLKI